MPTDRKSSGIKLQRGLASPSSSPMSLGATLTRYLLHLQDLRTQNKEFDVLSSSSYLGIGLLTTLFLYRYLIPKDEKGAIRKLGGFPIITAWAFFTKRYDFIWANFGSDPSPHFKFNVLQVDPLCVFVSGMTIGDLCSTM